MATILRTRGTLSINGGASSALVTHYWDSTGAAIGALATESVARVRAGWNAVTSAVGVGCTWTPNLVVDEIDENTGGIVNQVAAAAPAAVTFGATGDFLPLQTQVILQYQSALFINGRRVRGRSYIPGLTETSNAAGGVPSAGTLTTFAAFNTALGTTILTATNQRVWHRPNALGVGGLSAVVTTRSVSSSYGVLRSRRR